MRLLAAAPALVLIFGILWDAFETVVLPRRVVRPIRLTRMFFRGTWAVWRTLARLFPGDGPGEHESSSPRESFLGLFGPLALILLLTIWAAGLVLGFGVLQWALGSALAPEAGHPGFGADLYMSGTTLFTLGLGDVVPRSGLARAVTVIQSGIGFGFLALVIGYLPVLYQAFSRREENISLLDARAGSPPSAVELLRRNCSVKESASLVAFLRDWEGWAAQLLESHLSYPTLAYYRSQHENQSWLAALTAILDVCALIVTGIDEIPRRQAELTFAIARHAAVDLSQIFKVAPREPEPDRLPPEDFERMCQLLATAGLRFADEASAESRLRALRRLYEPYICSLGGLLVLSAPDWLPPPEAHDDWQTTAWDKASIKVMAGSRAKSNDKLPR